MLTLRKRGRYFHIRGSIRVGQETRIVKEHSTGCDRRGDAEGYRVKLEGELRTQILVGSSGQAQSATIADAGLAYVARPGGVKAYDLWRLDQINTAVGDFPISRAGQAWSEFKRVRCSGLAPATVERFRAIFQAALNHAASEAGFQAPKIRRTERIQNKRVRFLAREEADRLLDSYAPHVRPIVTVLAFQGLRIGEALRLEWQDVQWAVGALFVRETKSGDSRTVSMHARVRRALHRLWVQAGSPAAGRVFLNRMGKPYADPRRYRLPGGSPIRSAHATACARAGVQDFRIHDWRHHWASWCVMSGIDLETIRQEGGWKSLRMVERYAAVSAAHRREAMKRLK
jgi:integrase